MDKEKHIDESWKNTVENEKDLVKDAPDASAAEEFEMNFVNYLTSLVIQALVFLGEVPNPMSGEKVEINLKQAKLLIDTLLILRDKTKGNLAKEEEDFLNMALYELQMKFVEKTQAGSSSPLEGNPGPSIQV